MWCNSCCVPHPIAAVFHRCFPCYVMAYNLCLELYFILFLFGGKFDILLLKMHNIIKWPKIGQAERCSVTHLINISDIIACDIFIFCKISAFSNHQNINILAVNARVIKSHCYQMLLINIYLLHLNNCNSLVCRTNRENIFSPAEFQVYCRRSRGCLGPVSASTSSGIGTSRRNSVVKQWYHKTPEWTWQNSIVLK